VGRHDAVKQLIRGSPIGRNDACEHEYSTEFAGWKTEMWMRYAFLESYERIFISQIRLR
jgi:hypothetical protein